MGRTVHDIAARLRGRSVAPAGAWAVRPARLRHPDTEGRAGSAASAWRHHRWVFSADAAGPPAPVFSWRESCIATLVVADHGPAWTRSCGSAGACTPASRGVRKMPARLEMLANFDRLARSDIAGLRTSIAAQRRRPKARHSVAHHVDLTTLWLNWGTYTVGGGPWGSTPGCAARVNRQLRLHTIRSTGSCHRGARRP